jgi:hypothetical protein
LLFGITLRLGNPGHFGFAEVEAAAHAAAMQEQEMPRAE